MQPFSERQGELVIENTPASAVAERFGTPTLVYAASALTRATRRWAAAFAPLPAECLFAVKACPTVACLRLITGEAPGVCATSGSDLERAWLGGAALRASVLAGEAKNIADIRAALDGIYSPLFPTGMTMKGRPPYYRGPIGWITAATRDEFDTIAGVAAGLRVRPGVALRVRFHRPPGCIGIEAGEVKAIFDATRHAPLRPTGLHAHAGTAAGDPAIFEAFCRELAGLARELLSSGHEIGMLDAGGGFSPAIQPERYAEIAAEHLAPFAADGTHLVIEPGLAIAAGAGILLSRVRCMNNGRPLLDIGVDMPQDDPAIVRSLRHDKVGRPDAFRPGDIVALLNAGAYADERFGGTRTRPGPAEVLVDGTHAALVRKRPTLDARLAPELDAIQAEP